METKDVLRQVSDVLASEAYRQRGSKAQQALQEAVEGSTLLSPEERIIGIHAIPKFIHDYVSYAHSRTSAPILYHIGVSLSLLSVIVSRYARIPFAHKRIFPNIWLLLLGITRMFKKTTSIDIGLELLLAVLPDCIYSQEHSPEALIEEMATNAQKALIRDEFSGFLANMKRSYSEGHKEFLMNMYDCPDSYTRKLRKEELPLKKVYLPLLSGTTTNRFISNLTSDDWENGFLARFLFILPEELPPYRDATFIKDEHLEQRQRLIEELRGIKDMVRIRGRDIFMTGDALKRYNLYCSNLEKEIQSDADRIPLSGSYSELEVYAAKIASLMEIANAYCESRLADVDKLFISDSTLLSALVLTEIFKEQVRRLLMAQRCEISQSERKVVENIVLKYPGISYSDLLHRSHLRAERLKTIIDILKVEEVISQVGGNFYHA